MIYLDTSALLKLVRSEDHSAAFATFLTQHADEPQVSSVLIAIETRRAILRDAPASLPRADLLLTRVGQVGLGHAIVESAGRLPDPGLRSLDAIHVATALMLGSDLTSFVTYDKRLLASAAAVGLPAVRPT